jgi:hypothetical protein
MAAKVLTPEAAGVELAKVLKVMRRETEQLAELTKERKGRIAALAKRARELESIVLGDAVQVELDTSEPEPEAPPAVAAEVVGKKRGKGKHEALIRCPRVECNAIHRTGDGIEPACWEAMTPQQREQLISGKGTGDGIQAR